jgi:type IV pilus assembly protein PilB
LYEAIRQLIIKHASGDEIKTEAMRGGMLTLRMDGMEKVLSGATTIEQVLGSSEEDK